MGLRTTRGTTGAKARASWRWRVNRRARRSASPLSGAQPPPGASATTLSARLRLASSSTSAPPIEPALHRVARRGERILARLERRPTVMARERGRNHLELRDEFGEHRSPLVPGAHEAVEQHERLAVTGAVQRGGDLGPRVHLKSASDASAAPVNLRPFGRLQTFGCPAEQPFPIVALDREQVLHVARLARLELTSDELERMARELSHVLDHIEKIRELDL